MSQDVRPSPLAGRWYPAQAGALESLLEQFVEKAQQNPADPQGQVLGLLAPHAGIRFSGPVAAHAFNTVKNRTFDTVVVIGPLHYDLPGKVLTTTYDAYQTPLGTIPVDKEVVQALQKISALEISQLRDDPEHSIEIELPFLQHLISPGFRLVPLMMRDQSIERSKALGTALADILHHKKVLFVASSDLSHFYPQKIAYELDMKMLSRVEAMDSENVVRYNQNGEAFACGHGAIATMLYAIQAWDVNSAKIVNYATSGDVSGDYERVVGYGAARFSKV